MMKMKYILAACAVTLFLTGCFHDFHEEQPGMGYIVPQFLWELADDADAPIDHLDIAVQGTSTAFSVEYASVQECAADLLAVPAGEYDLLFAANMTAANGYALRGLPATRAVRQGGYIASPATDAAPSAQAWFSVLHVSVQKGETSYVRPVLQRLLSPLSLEIANLPAGAELSIQLTRVANGIILNSQDESGRYGVPSSLAIESQTLTGSGMYLFPTVAGSARTALLINIHTDTGLEHVCICDAPRIDVGKSYTLQLDYNELQPYMTLTSSSISPWEEGWTVSGEILNPKN